MQSLTSANLAIATAIWMAFVGGLFILRKLVPGPLRQGQLLRDGTRKTYKLNGLYLLLILAASLAAGQATHLFTLATVHRLFWPLCVVANVFSFLHTGWLFVVGR